MTIEIFAINFQRETLTEHHNRAEDSGLNRSPILQCSRMVPHTIANKLTGFLLFLAVPTIGWYIIPIAIVAMIATFAAIQECHSIRHKINSV